MGDNGDYWFTSPKGVVRFSEGGAAELYDERNGLPGMNPSLVWGRPRPLQAISRDAAGSLWLTDLYSMQSELLSLRAPEGWDVVDNYGGFADTEGNYWFGTHGNGLFRARKQTVTAYTKAQGLNAREVYPLLEARDGSIWIGTRRDGLFRFKDGVFTNYAGKGAFEKYVSSLYEDRAGQLWVNGPNGDTWRFTGASFVREIWKGVAYGSLGAVRTMCEDDAGAYWIGSEGGVVRYQNGVAIQYTTKDGLAGDDTKVIVPDVEDGVWLGGDGGLTHYNDGKFTAWAEKDGLPGAAVRALKQDDDGTLWIGTYDSGLARFKDGRFTRYTTRDGLYDDGVFQILEDDYGWLWMSCNRGVYRVRKQELNNFADGKSKEITSPGLHQGRWNAERPMY
jgi:ligand-binding sensor domain-containing protein